MAGWIITTAVGTGEKGFDGDGGPAAQARLNGPFDVAFDRAGNLYFSDTFNYRVRRVAAQSGIIATVAGNGEKGYSGDGGPATEAALSEPYGIVLDRAGNLYIADRLNRRVRRVDAASGAITTIATDLAEPNGLAFDPTETRLFIADVADHRVRVLDIASGRRGRALGRRRPGNGGRSVRGAGGQGRRRRHRLHSRTPGQQPARGRSRRRHPHRRRHRRARLWRRRRAGARRGVRRAEGDGARPRRRRAGRRYREPRDPPLRSARRHRLGAGGRAPGGRRRRRPGGSSRARPAARRRRRSRRRDLYRRHQQPPNPEAGAGLARRLQEAPQFGDEVLGIVALHGVAGARHGDEAAVRQAAGEADAVFLVEHVAFAAAHDQGRAGDAPEPLGEPGAVGAVRILAQRLEPARVVFPLPGAVGLPPQIVHQAAPQDRRVAARVEFHRLLDDRLDRDGLLHRVDEVADAARSRAAHLGPGVDDDEMGEPLGLRNGKGERVDRTERHADENEPVEAELVDKAGGVAQRRGDRIIAVGRPVGVAVAALVGRDAAVFVAQGEADKVPGMGGQRAAVEKDDRRQMLVAP